MKLKHIDHIGVIVNNLEVAKKFFTDLGFIVQGEADEKNSALLDKVIGIKNAHSQIVFLATPDGETKLELTKFLNPSGEVTPAESVMYAHGYKHIALVVEGIDEIVEGLKAKGMDIFVDVYNYQDAYKLCYFRGPEGILVELAEELKQQAVSQR
jgi:catechol 2,3-dioxygenase-like lactoylglutathione lyase family enzyme